MKTAAIVGYKNHALKLKNILTKFIDLKYIYHPKKNLNYKFTNNINYLLKVDCVFIACPSIFHFKYLNYLKKQNYKGFIFCEKLPVTNIKDLKKLQKLADNRMYFNFNLRHSIIAKILKTKIYGNLRNVIIIDNKPFFKKFNNKKNNWRSKDKNILITNIFPHYLHVLKENLPDLGSNFKIYKIKKKNIDEGVSIIYKSNNCICNLNMSYFRGLEKTYIFYFDKSKIEINNNLLKVFKYPKIKTGLKFQPIKLIKSEKLKDIFYNSNVQSVKYFIEHVEKKKKFQINQVKFDLEINRILLNAI